MIMAGRSGKIAGALKNKSVFCSYEQHFSVLELRCVGKVEQNTVNESTGHNEHDNQDANMFHCVFFLFCFFFFFFCECNEKGTAIRNTKCAGCKRSHCFSTITCSCHLLRCAKQGLNWSTLIQCVQFREHCSRKKNDLLPFCKLVLFSHLSKMCRTAKTANVSREAPHLTSQP